MGKIMFKSKWNILILVVCLTDCKDVFSQSSTATVNEKKADYLERIYFSGKNKEGLRMLFLTTTQEMEQKAATESVAKQYAFLSSLKANVDAAESACDILEMIAAGIFQLDAIEAASLGVSLPGDQAKTKSFDALGAVSKVGSSANNISTKASNTAVQSYVLSGGKTNVLGSASKIAGAAGKASAAADAIGAGIGMVNDIRGIGKGLGLGGGDKPCKKVPQKDIAIGDHIAAPADATATAEKAGEKADENGTAATQAAAGTKIILKNVTYNQLSAITSSLEKEEGISAVNGDDYNNKTANLVISHRLKIKQVIDKILQSNPKINFNIASVSSNEATLEIK